MDNGRSFAVESLEEFHDLLSLTGMEIAGRLVGKYKLRTGDDGPRNSDQLLLPPGQLVGVEVLLPTI